MPVNTLVFFIADETTRARADEKNNIRENICTLNTKLRSHFAASVADKTNRAIFSWQVHT